jgi:hypothetical protein
MPITQSPLLVDRVIASSVRRFSFSRLNTPILFRIKSELVPQAPTTSGTFKLASVRIQTRPAYWLAATSPTLTN